MHLIYEFLSPIPIVGILRRVDIRISKVQYIKMGEIGSITLSPYLPKYLICPPPTDG